mgnify:CR=1 FL=1
MIVNTQTLLEKFLSSTGVSTDTRKIQAGNLFFALKGPNFNANAMAAEALEKGAQYAITSINLALALAQTKRTLLIDADMRRPQVGTRLGMAANAKGLSNLVTGSATLKDCVHQIEGSTLLVMPSGDVPPNPLDLLVSQRFKDVLRHLQPQLDFIIIDTPPVELVSDAVAVAQMATSTIYVVRATETPVPVIRKGISRLQRSGPTSWA